MKRLLILVVLLSLGLNIGLFVALDRADDRAGETAGGRRDWHGARGRSLPQEERAALRSEGRRLWREMSPQQRERVDSLRTRIEQDAGPLRAELDSTRQALRRALTATELDDVRILALMDRMTAAQARLDSTVAQALIQQLRTSTPEERRRLLRMMPWERGGHGRGQDGPGPR